MTNREIDDLVHESVMGYQMFKFFVDWVPFKPKVPRYSTDIAAAWEVVEKIKDTKGNDSTFKIQWLYDTWIVYWDHEDFLSSSDNYPQSKSAAVAICLAALKSVGVEVTLDKLESE